MLLQRTSATQTNLQLSSAPSEHVLCPSASIQTTESRIVCQARQKIPVSYTRGTLLSRIICYYMYDLARILLTAKPVDGLMMR